MQMLKKYFGNYTLFSLPVCDLLFVYVVQKCTKD